MALPNLYISVASFTAALNTKLVSDLSKTSGTDIDSAKVEQCIHQASRTVDSFLLGKVAVPLTDAALIAVFEPHVLNIARVGALEMNLLSGDEDGAQKLFDMSVEYLQGFRPEIIASLNPAPTATATNASWRSLTPIYGTGEADRA
jgi:phage gp36-like protein